MENTLKEAFAHIHMSDACEENILKSFQKRPCKPLWIRFAAVATVCFVMMVLLFTNPNIVQALEDVLESVSESISNLFHPAIPSTKHYTVHIPESTETENTATGKTPTSGGSSFITVPLWLEERADGLYFLANGEEIEIGSLITEEVPFTYVYTDGRTTYYLVVGGTYVAEGAPLEGVGWAMWLQDAKLAEKDPAVAWQDGYSAGTYDPKTGQSRAWYQAGKEILGIPFP